MDAAMTLARVARSCPRPHAEDELVRDLARARVVCLGESTHGTHEFYVQRARITRRLLVDHGFRALLLEADLPDTWRVHRFASGAASDREELAALGDFQRFPRWMWRNAVMRGWVRWMARSARSGAGTVGLWGMDLYGLHRLGEMVHRIASAHDPVLAARVHAALAGLGPEDERVPRGPGAARAARFLAEVVAEIPEGEGALAARLAARGVRAAVDYGRVVFTRHTSGWNVRDLHMADVVGEVLASLGDGGRVVVWAHNSHVGDARPSAFGRMGELSLGQVLRQRLGADAVRLVGLLTRAGTVTAAHDWGGDPHPMTLRPAPAGGWEALLHTLGESQMWLDLRGLPVLAEREERAVGVIYVPRAERTAHLFASRLPERYDHVIYTDRTRALVPLDPWGAVAEEEPELPETWPFGL